MEVGWPGLSSPGESGDTGREQTRSPGPYRAGGHNRGRQTETRWVIHAVGPVYRADDPRMDELLRSAVWNSLMLAHQRGLKSIAFPAISSGIFGFPKKPCAANLISTVLDFTAQYPDSTLRDIRFTIIDSPTVNVFLQEFKEKFNQSG